MNTPQLSPKVLVNAGRYRTLLEINNAIITNLTQESLLDAICEAIQHVLPVYRAAINLYNPETDKLRMLALSKSWNSEYFRVGVEINRQDSHFSLVLDQKQPLFCSDIETVLAYPCERQLFNEGVQSYCIAPLILGGRSIGTLNIGSDLKGRYSQEDADFLHEAAGQVALAIGNMQSYQEIAALSNKVEYTAQRYRTLLEINNAIVTNLDRDALLHAISESMHTVIPFDRAAFTLYDPSKDKFRFLAIEGLVSSTHFRAGLEFSREESISAWVFDHRRSALCHDLLKEQRYPNDRYLIAEGLNSYCVAPLIVGGKCIGTLNLASEKTSQYTEDDAEFLSEVGSQVALAVSNMTVYEEVAALKTTVEHTAERYRTLLQINNAIITNLTQESLLPAICEALEEVLPVYRAALTLYEPVRDTLRIFALSKDWQSGFFRVGLEIKRSESHSGWVLEQQRPLLRHDLEKEWQYPVEQRLLEEGIRSFCAVPLKLQGKVIGTLNIGSDVKARYSEADAEFLLEVAGQVALAIGNMNSYEQIAALNTRVERTAERHRTLLEVNNAIINQLTPEALVRSVSDTLRRVAPQIIGVVVSIYNPETQTFRYLAREGGAPSAFVQTGREFARSESMSGWVVDHQRAVIRNDLEKEQQYPNDKLLLANGIHSDCIAPLILGGKSIGTLNVGSKAKNQYSDADLEILQGVANQVALAVANMQAYEEIVELKARLEKENVYLQEEIRTEHNFEEIIGNSPPLMAVLRKVEQVAPTDSTVLINGETGTGKELIARAIHDRSDRKKRPLLKVNCSAISAGLVESELFGHVKGAFTGAFERHIGRFELADGGTIFLDEIGELPLETQVKLLRVLQEREFEPVGSNKPVHVDVRVIAATNRNLQESIRSGTFRSDLFYRLNVFPIEVPPLRERQSDIPQLAMFFLTRFSRKFGKNIEGMAQSTLDRLSNYSWPGNIRELQNVIERATILSQSSVLELESDLVPALKPVRAAVAAEASVQPGDSAPSTPATSTPSTLEEMERGHILAALKQTRGVVEGPNGAAKILGLHPNTLRHRIQKLGLKRTTYHES